MDEQQTETMIELLQDILSELRSMKLEVESIRHTTTLMELSSSGVGEDIRHLGDRITGGYGDSPDTDLHQLKLAIDAVETSIDLR